VIECANCRVLCLRAAMAVAGCLFLASAGYAADDGAPILPAPAPYVAPAPINDARILGVIPDFQTVTETNGHAAPLTRKQKWMLAMKETIDPFNIANAALTAGFSQKGNQTPKYGEGGRAYSERFGAAFGDFATQNFFSAGVLASVLHQDPRYFRKGPEAKIPSRILYSLSRIVVARQDSGRASFNASGIFGMMLGIAASNLYYPSASVRGPVMAGRIETSLLGGVTGNLMSEFWPDIQKKFFHRKHGK
jgi:hypothetical protein